MGRHARIELAAQRARERRSQKQLEQQVDWADWQHDNEPSDYVLWNKNRAGQDVCDPTPVGELAVSAVCRAIHQDRMP